MGTLLTFKNLYFNAFDENQPKYLVTLLKAYSIFCGLMITMAMYAFFYRAFTGFRF
ncbi:MULTISPECIES: DUF6747 family protein [Croceitalea]|uniref:DUF6747 family protein n=1 Tax=Croceitalea vernalis TaxID=3075599 RepID=A0ABU3BGF0_9FLAO|nr:MULTISPECIES: DUF6747 family protein [unclassified Croceitalea]MDT0539455.1 DUF6747 family protein [Croceitalea sp. P059]MDT0621248.1 DUF6747 family protein [Croceitalea sp. P007]